MLRIKGLNILGQFPRRRDKVPSRHGEDLDTASEKEEHKTSNGSFPLDDDIPGILYLFAR